MRSSWAQPSLSRDFMLLSAAVIFVLTIVSGWITFRTYEKHLEKITIDLNKEAVRIDNAISAQMSNANYMLSSLGRQIIIDPNRDYTKLAQSLKSFDNKNYIYSIFSWINTDKKMVVSSNKGVLEEPVDISDRDFVQQAATDSWKMHVGHPIEGRVSGRWVIPVSMGITDYTGKFIGIVALSIDIGILTEEIENLVKHDGISFAIVSKDASSKFLNKELVVLTEVSDSKNFLNDNFPAGKLSDIDLEKNPSGLVSVGSLIRGTGIYTFYRVSENFPYVVLMGYDANYSDETVHTMLWGRLLQIFMVAIFFVVFLWIVRMRVISPVMDITEVVASIAKGNKFLPLKKKGQVELEALVEQIEQVSKYIDENKRIENELRNKMFLLKKAKETAELNVRSKSEFLSYVAQEMRIPLNNIIGFAQVLKDNTYSPIDSRKCAQYATDIFAIANQLIDKIQDIIAHAKAEGGYIDLQEKPLDIHNFVNLSIRQIENKLLVRKVTVKTHIGEHLPHLLADEFRLQQIIVNLLLLVLDFTPPEGVINIEAKIISEQNEKQFFILSFGDAAHMSAHRDVPYMAIWNNGNIQSKEQMDLRFELVRMLVSLHGGVLHSEAVSENADARIYTIIFPDSRLVFSE